ncbi:PhoPQ-activated pathogenicity-related family protein [Cyclobacterium amurskyense]|uniref:PhoPQ-activated pathogenicity-related protein PqaA type n=1 Tax=Cyclobacterium amurskyense TaxID=320787 RepID=A0A0H4P5Y6_9BACT|nr:PhoPQ-activated pathogenicity-related family protein [Cyclobacterium amurskyense]AKP49504.1 PhoPQ-activated pathogenicity-related protein PqaA type [Cyclobacterium amurskyense]|tara:strand:- start:10607 stop:12082 length:1476 start_codon:yes stop_codon:yes gene_type:complete
MFKIIKIHKTLHLALLIGISLFCFPHCQSKTSSDTEIQTVEEKVRGIDLLKAYVEKDQDVYDYELAFESKGDGYSYYVLKVISQNWLTEKEVTETTWWHWVSFVVPDELKHNTSLLIISGGSKNTTVPEKPDDMILQAALSTGSTAIKVHNIPFQPLQYVGDTSGLRTEDGLIAYGWREFMERGAKDEDAIWLARFPMTKAVVSAMDAVVDYSKTNLDISLDKYVVAGASKRGWTTWTTAAVDDRVIGMIPIVIDMLNLSPSFKHHWQTYGFWAPAVNDYTFEGIFDWMDSKEFKRLEEIVEPYQFLEEYKDIPKLLINGSGDQFFLPDSWRYYWEELQGESHIAYIPNAGHGLKNSDAPQILLGFYSHIINNIKRPSYSWEVKEDAIHIKTDINNPPVAVKLWSATNENTRDFRIDVLGPQWKATNIPFEADGEYVIPIAAPSKGWSGHYVELTYAGDAPLKFTTGIKILPDTYEHELYVPKERKGTPVE